MIARISLNKLLLAIMLVMSVNVSAQTKYSEQVIVYSVFDSLEGLLCNRIDSLNKDSVYILIEPAGDFRYIRGDGLKSNNYLYNIGIYYKHAYPTDSIFNVSNRKMNICGRLYPIYFQRFDDVFTGKDKNTTFNNFEISGRVDIYQRPRYVVDMENKKVILATFYH